MNKFESLLLANAISKSDELVNNFSLKNLAIENKFKSKLLNDVNSAKTEMMIELKESLKLIVPLEKQKQDKSTNKTETRIDLKNCCTKRINYQRKLYKTELDTKLELNRILKEFQKMDNMMKNYFESTINETEINDLNDLFAHLNPSIEKSYDCEDDLNKLLKESITIRNAINSFEIKCREIIDNMRPLLTKRTMDFQAEITFLKSEFENQLAIDFKKDDQNLNRSKQNLKNELENHLKKIIDNLILTSTQNKQIQMLFKNLIKIRTIYTNRLNESDYQMIIHYFDHFKWFRKRLWTLFHKNLIEMINNLNSNVPSDISNQMQTYKSDISIIRSLNECINKLINFYEQLSNKTVLDQTLDAIVKKLKEFDEQFLIDLKSIEKESNKEMTTKFI